MQEDEALLKRTPLYKKHLALGARMVPFSGWEMPVQYTGIIDEHLHTREKAGLFDICHMGELFIKGENAAREVDRLVTCETSDMPEGKCRYGFLLNKKGGIVDDLIVFKISQQEFMLVVNAGTRDKDREWIEKNISKDVSFFDDSDNVAKLDIQGPLSGKVMSGLVGEDVIEALKRFWFLKVEIDGINVLLSRTGYTGELGFELFFPSESAEKLWDRLLEDENVKPVGLGARDTLRMEVGYSLYGLEIDEERTPIEAGLSRFIHMDKDFIGKEALIEETADRILTGFICEGRRSAREKFIVKSGSETIGEVTSGSFSPCLKKGIGLCYIKKDFSGCGTSVVLSDGKVEIKAEIKKPPLYEH